jgi:hypothetical protein
MCKYNVEIPLPPEALMLRIQGHSRPAHLTSCFFPILSSPSTSTDSRVLSSLPRSVVSTSIAPVSNKLESTNHLTNCEETQALGHDNTSGYQLLLIDVSELLEHASR